MTDRREIEKKLVGLKEVVWLIALILGMGMAWQRIGDTQDRQLKYIERRNAQHVEMKAEINKLSQEIDDLKLFLAARHGEVPKR